MNHFLAQVKPMRDGQTYRSRSWNVELAWAAWCEALGFSEGQ